MSNLKLPQIGLIKKIEQGRVQKSLKDGGEVCKKNQWYHGTMVPQTSRVSKKSVLISSLSHGSRSLDRSLDVIFEEEARVARRLRFSE